MFESKNERSDSRSHASLALIRGDRDDLTNQWLNSMKGIVDSDGKFGKIIQEMYKQEYKTTFEKLETWYENEAKNKRNDIRSHVGLALIMSDRDDLMTRG